MNTNKKIIAVAATLFIAGAVNAADLVLPGADYTTESADIATAVNGKADKATTLSGYGITDAYNKGEVDGFVSTLNGNISAKADQTYVDTELGKKANSSDVYTKGEVDAALGTKANVSDVYTKTEVDGFVSTLDGNISAKADQTYVDTELGKKANSSDVYTKGEVDAALGTKADVSDVYTKTEVDNQNSLQDGKIANNTTAIGNNTTAIAQNATAIANNTTEIGTHTTQIANNTAAINGHTADISANKTQIATNTSDIAVAKADILSNKADITTNKTNIATNKTNIENNAANIATNAGKISANESKISANETAIAANKTKLEAQDGLIAANTTQINKNTADITTNKTNIATNKTNIEHNTADIATNKADILTNKADIATNKANIATNAGKIAANETAIAKNHQDIGDVTTLVGAKGSVVKTTTNVTDAVLAIDSDFHRGTDGKIHIGENSFILDDTTGDISFVAPGALNESAINFTKTPTVNGVDVATMDNINALDGRVTSVNNRVSDLKDETRTGMASVAALTALQPLGMDAGKLQFQLGTGFYQGEAALAAGANYYATENIAFNAGVAADTGFDNNVVKAGVSFGFLKPKKKYTVNANNVTINAAKHTSVQAPKDVAYITPAELKALTDRIASLEAELAKK